MSNYLVEDGYTADFYIKEIEGIHGPVNMRFRPMIREEREAYEKHARMLRKGETETSKMAKLVCERVVEWDIPVELEPSVVVRMVPVLLDGIFYAVMGYRASDQRPDEGDSLTKTPEREEAPAECEDADLKN